MYDKITKRMIRIWFAAMIFLNVYLYIVLFSCIKIGRADLNVICLTVIVLYAICAIITDDWIKHIALPAIITLEALWIIPIAGSMIFICIRSNEMLTYQKILVSVAILANLTQFARNCIKGIGYVRKRSQEAGGGRSSQATGRREVRRGGVGSGIMKGVVKRSVRGLRRRARGT
jgi:hypothetical protein